MNRPFAAFLIGAALLSQAALAGDSSADAGRYQLIPNALIPNKAGKIQERSVLLDTTTGRTWHLVQGAQAGGAKGLRWMPLDITFADRVNSASQASSGFGKKPLDTSPTSGNRRKRLGEDYDNDP